MANELHLQIIKQGTDAWNKWRKENPDIQPDIRSAYLRGVNLSGANLTLSDLVDADLLGAKLVAADLSMARLRKASLSWADLSKTNLHAANLSGANLNSANLVEADLSRANLIETDFSWADLRRANLSGADLSQANLCEAKLNQATLKGASLRGADCHRTHFSGANLTNASLVDTNLNKANLANCRVYGISAWNLRLRGANQSDLIITHSNEPTITVDNLELAQFIYLLLNNKKIRDVIDTITSKVVLILGRFTPERKAVLDAIRNELRRRNYLPVLFDFDKPASLDITETVSTLAHLSRFVIADITDARSIPQELQRIVPDLPSVPVQPILQVSTDKYGMFEHFERYPWVLKIHRYEGLDDLFESLRARVIAPAEEYRHSSAE